MPQRRHLALLVAACASGLLGCGTSSTVRHENSMVSGTTVYATYAVLDHPVGHAGSLDGRVTQSIHQVMGLKGYERRAADQSDLLVSYKFLLSGERGPLAPLHGPLPPAGAQPNDVRGRAWGVDVLEADFVGAMQPDAPREKVLLVMLQDSRTFRVVWMGWAQSEVMDSTLERQTDEALARIMIGIPEVKP